MRGIHGQGSSNLQTKSWQHYGQQQMNCQEIQLTDSDYNTGSNKLHFAKQQFKSGPGKPSLSLTIAFVHGFEFVQHEYVSYKE